VLVRKLKYPPTYITYSLLAGRVKILELAKTWVKGLDETLGGLPDKSVILTMGEPGSGHDLLAQQILYLHALKKGKSTYFTTFKPDIVVKNDFADYGWELDGLEKGKRWEIVDARSMKSIQAFRKKLSLKIGEGSWTLIDSFSHLLMKWTPEQAFGIIETLLDGSRTYGGVHLLVLTEGMHTTQTEMAVEEFVDGVIEFVSKEVGGGINRRIKIKKMKAIHVSRLIPFNLTPQGITVETAVRIA